MPTLSKPRLYRSMTFAASARRRIQQFGPYQSLAVLLVPLLVVEPLKVTGLAFVGLGGGWGLHDCRGLRRRNIGFAPSISGRKIQALHDGMVRDIGWSRSSAIGSVASRARSAAVAWR
jgi:hypothetical protein